MDRTLSVHNSVLFIPFKGITHEQLQREVPKIKNIHVLNLYPF